MTVCVYYLKGICKFDDRCKNSHDPKEGFSILQRSKFWSFYFLNTLTTYIFFIEIWNLIKMHLLSTGCDSSTNYRVLYNPNDKKVSPNPKKNLKVFSRSSENKDKS